MNLEVLEYVGYLVMGGAFGLLVAVIAYAAREAWRDEPW